MLTRDDIEDIERNWCLTRESNGDTMNATALCDLALVGLATIAYHAAEARVRRAVGEPGAADADAALADAAACERALDEAIAAVRAGEK